MKVGAVLPVLVASFCAPGISWAHDWYSALRQPGSGQSCCRDSDCHRVDDDEIRFFGGQLQIFIEGSWRTIAPGLILSTTSPDGGLHACWTSSGSNHFTPHGPHLRILCVILPPES